MANKITYSIYLLDFTFFSRSLRMQVFNYYYLIKLVYTSMALLYFVHAIPA